MRTMMAAVLLVVAGCSGSGLSMPDGSCRYAFSSPSSEAGESSHCTMTEDGQLTLSFDDSIRITVDDASASGQARLEGVSSLRARHANPGERFGLASFDYKGQQCESWGGHVFWDSSAGGWHVEAVGSCGGFTFSGSFDSL